MYIVASTGHTGEYTVPAGQLKEWTIIPTAGHRVARVRSVLFGPTDAPAGATTGTQIIVVQNGVEGQPSLRLPLAQATFSFDKVASITGSRPNQDSVDLSLTYPIDEGAFADAVRAVEFSDTHPLILRYSNNTDADYVGTIVCQVLYTVMD